MVKWIDELLTELYHLGYREMKVNKTCNQVWVYTGNGRGRELHALYPLLLEMLDNREYKEEIFNISDLVEVVDWYSVPKDAKVLVRNQTGDKWLKKYFAEYKDGKFYCYAYGNTSWTANGDTYTWEYCRLADG